MARLGTLLLVTLLCTGCVFHTHCTELNGLTDNDGQAFAHQGTSIVAVHLLFGLWAVLSDGGIENAVSEFSAAAAERGATQVRITQSSSDAWWWVLPPLTFIFTPVTSHISGDVR